DYSFPSPCYFWQQADGSTGCRPLSSLLMTMVTDVMHLILYSSTTAIIHQHRLSCNMTH
ncbi:hypothetical protein GBAR_LOCUS12836, partial [Geodia barretti]